MQQEKPDYLLHDREQFPENSTMFQSGRILTVAFNMTVGRKITHWERPAWRMDHTQTRTQIAPPEHISVPHMRQR